MKEFRRVTLMGRDNAKTDTEVDKLLEEGWEIKDMCPFSEHVSSHISIAPNLCRDWTMPREARGDYGVVYYMQRETRKKKESPIEEE